MPPLPVRSWQTYVALLAVTLGSLSSVSLLPTFTRLIFGVAAVGMILIVFGSLLRSKRAPKAKGGFDPYERIEQIREERQKRR